MHITMRTENGFVTASPEQIWVWEYTGAGQTKYGMGLVSSDGNYWKLSKEEYERVQAILHCKKD